MANQELQSKIKALISQQTGDTADSNKEALRQILVLADNMDEAISQRNAENQSRRLKNEELEKQISAKDEEIKQLNNTQPELTRLKALEAEYLAAKKQGFDKRLADWNKKAEIFKVDNTHKLFDKIEKAKDKFVFPVDDKTPLTDEQLAANETAYAIFETTGYFQTDDKQIPALPRPGGDNSQLIKTSGEALFTMEKK
jgi:hypothetical protein